MVLLRGLWPFVAMNGIKGFYLLLAKIRKEKKKELFEDARRGKSGYSSRVVAGRQF